jgi:hypothetical protein
MAWTGNAGVIGGKVVLPASPVLPRRVDIKMKGGAYVYILVTKIKEEISGRRF